MEQEAHEFKDSFVASVVKNAPKKELSEDFEEDLMNTIRHTHSYKRELSVALKRSALYFSISLLLIGGYAFMKLFGISYIKDSFIVPATMTLFFSILTAIIFFSNYNRFFKSLLNL